MSNAKHLRGLIISSALLCSVAMPPFAAAQVDPLGQIKTSQTSDPATTPGADLGMSTFDESLIAKLAAGAVPQAFDAEGGIAAVCTGNLVTNGDFETVGTCPNYIGQVAFAPPWYLPTPGSADFFHTCAGSGIYQPGIPVNYYGSVTPYSGNGVGGFRVYGNVPPNTTTDYREYLQIPLNASLVGGQTYTVSFYVILSGLSSSYGIKELSAYFSAGPLYSPNATQLNVIPQFTNPGPPVTSTSSWTLVTGTFVAAGGENHMTLGNFKNDATTTAVVAGGGCCPVAYYYLDDVCVTGMQGTLLGACCYQSAVGPQCQLMTSQQCASLNGYFYGKGSNCNGVQCANVAYGACCFPGPTGTNLCQIATPADCAGMGGTYLGNGSTCTPGNPCNPPTGACCYNAGLPINQCIIVTQQACINTYGGTYMGDNSVCTPDPCNQQGACCYGKPGFPTNFCVITNQYTCTQQYGGTYMGNGTTCQPDPCNPPPATGACCYQIPGTTIFTCIQTTQQLCATYFNSTFYGVGSPCTPNLCGPPPQGACCYPDATGAGNNCVVTTQQDCVNNLHGTYQGNGTSCVPDPCNPPKPTGACCYQDIPNATFLCTITTQLDCLQNFPNSTYMGNGSSCTPNPCPAQLNGACCYIDATGLYACVITNAQDCVTIYHGVYQGNNTLCTPNPCAPTGACCYQTAVGPVCVITTAADCATIYSGIYQGDNTGCNPNPCVPVGACCYQNAVGFQCVQTTQQLCATQYNGSWLGANSSCTPNPCVPTGACCFQDVLTAPIQCVVVSQAVCATYPNSSWQGANTTCGPNSCPSGACCYQIPGTTIFTCVQTTAQTCANLFNSTFHGVGSTCANVNCQPCVKPPKKMVAWWRLEELAGGIAHDAIAGHHGAYKPTPATGPTPLPGMVGDCLGFDGVNDFVQVPHSPALNFNCGPFSIDAWIRPLVLGGGIVRKGGPIGYDFHVLSTGQLRLALATGSGTCFLTSTGSIPVAQWSHVAVTASGGGATRTVDFYINGVPAGTSSTTCVCVGNTAPLLIGNSATTGLIKAKLDEIEVFNRVLASSEVLGLYTAGSTGKCKTRVHGTWNFPFCLNQNQVTVPVTICNDSPVPYNYNVSFQPLNTCTIPGPTVFTPLFTNPVTVPANNCVTVQVTINRPAGMNAVNQIACYQITALNLVTGQSFYGQGSVQDRRDLCAVIGPCCIGTGVIDIPVGAVKNIGLVISNTSGQAVNVPFMLKAYDSDDKQPSEVVRLNGLPPGTRYIGNLSIPAGGSTPLNFDVDYPEHNALAIDDILLSADVDGDGTFEPLISVSTASVPLLCSADVAADGFVNIDDLLAVINSWGPCVPPNPCDADIAPPGGNGTVNIDDLLAVINAWGPCP